MNQIDSHVVIVLNAHLFIYFIYLFIYFFSEIIPDSPSLFYEDVIRDEKLKDIANKITNITSSTTTQEKDRKNRWTMSETQIDETPTRDDVNKQKRPQSLSIISTAPSIISVVKKKTAPQSSSDIINYQKGSHSHERGDPDGDCGMEESPTNYCNKATELRVKLPSEEILHSKSGWLLKDDHTGEWSKYWFSLKGGGLFYYRDPAAEERGVLDGVLDVNSITSIKEIASSRNHAFQLTVITSLIIFFIFIFIFIFFSHPCLFAFFFHSSHHIRSSNFLK